MPMKSQRQARRWRRRDAHRLDSRIKMFKLCDWRTFSGIFAPIALSLLLFACLPVRANKPPAAITEKSQALDDLRQRIDKLNRDLAKSEESRGEVADQLKVSEQAISEVNRNLTALAKDQLVISREWQEIERRADATRADIAREENLRDRLLRHQYMHGNTDALRLVLGGEDVALVARQLANLGYVTRARIATIARLNKNVADLALIEAEVRNQQGLLSANAEAQKKARATLLTERASRQKVLNRIRADISKSQREVGRLKRDENRLTRLVEQIAMELARQVAPRDSPRKKSEPAPRIRKPGEAVSEEADSGFAGRAFASLQGLLKLPVKGELAGRFGAQREEGGVTWKGLFIRATDGLAVRAVADGRVVYADWLRGYGNLVIVDHGAGYLSLYGHNESLAKQVGENTSAGEPIASVGSTGGALESGVYFELRHQGKPFDPMRWVGRR